jgi:hypothetical protein
LYHTRGGKGDGKRAPAADNASTCSRKKIKTRRGLTGEAYKRFGKR